ncbi:sigma-70 family RNA polymerase sigma factor [Anatilimnocola floriformis]|uniref:sigma-70 family RNA polymerase sigma factor n=1 Tax=Anatilimnocola floriformis TaxID=2948575 RepID=UPI0020C5A81C|nr:sigma-70 family RNA polymerase sigma factor [Anatilimnocola floriformis]
MSEDRTTIAVERYLVELANLGGNSPAEPIVRALIDRSVKRLNLLCHSLLARSYPRLMHPPLNLQAEEMLSAVVDRLLKAMREVRPATVRQFFGLANQHMRWELNDLARQLDSQKAAEVFQDEFAAVQESSASRLSPNAVRMLEAIDSLPEEEREVFSLVRFQGMAHSEVADLLNVSTKTVQRRLNRGLMLLASKLGDLNPESTSPKP